MTTTVCVHIIGFMPRLAQLLLETTVGWHTHYSLFMSTDNTKTVWHYWVWVWWELSSATPKHHGQVCVSACVSNIWWQCVCLWWERPFASVPDSWPTCALEFCHTDTRLNKNNSQKKRLCLFQQCHSDTWKLIPVPSNEV